MLTRTRTVVAAAVVAVALGALVPLHARPAAAACNEPPAEITKTITSRSGISITRVENFKRVEGLISEQVSTDQGTVETLSIPDWLSQAYGGNRVALERDLEAGILKDRGRCF